MVQKYNRRGLKITDYHGDNDFDLEELPELLGADEHICASDEHIGGIERSIRVIKERARCMCHSVPYKKYPKLMTISLIESVIYWLNHFPSKNGVSQTLSPANIVIGRPKPNFHQNWWHNHNGAAFLKQNRNTDDFIN